MTTRHEWDGLPLPTHCLPTRYVRKYTHTNTSTTGKALTPQPHRIADWIAAAVPEWVPWATRTSDGGRPKAVVLAQAEPREETRLRLVLPQSVELIFLYRIIDWTELNNYSNNKAKKIMWTLFFSNYRNNYKIIEKLHILLLFSSKILEKSCQN